MTIFKKIIDGEVPAKVVHEDELCLAFKDLNPQAPVHILIIPKEEIPTLDAAKENHREVLGHLLWIAAEIARKEGFSEDGYRVVMNTKRDGGQEVYHIHLHLLAGRRMAWPPG